MIFLKVFKEKLGYPFYLNGDSYKNTYHMTCDLKTFKKNYNDLGLTEEFVKKWNMKPYSTESKKAK